MERKASEGVKEGGQGSLDVGWGRGTEVSKRVLLVGVIGMPGKTGEAGKRKEGVRSNRVRRGGRKRGVVGGGLGRE